MTPVCEYTVRAYASREQVSEKTVRRWVLKGAVATRRTAGGGIRIIEEATAATSRVIFFGTSEDNPGHLSR